MCMGVLDRLRDLDVHEVLDRLMDLDVLVVLDKAQGFRCACGS